MGGSQQTRMMELGFGLGEPVNTALVPLAERGIIFQKSKERCNMTASEHFLNED